jgi:hypothetical protein
MRYDDAAFSKSRTKEAELLEAQPQVFQAWKQMSYRF